jgi:hypothetical protein
VISPTARGWRIRRRWRGQFPPGRTPIHAMVHRRWLVEATCLGIPPERWVWQVAGRRESVGWSRRSLRRWPVTTQPSARRLRARRARAAARAAGFPMSRARVPQQLRRMPESALEVLWDLLVLLALVAIGFAVRNLLARRR